jgi:drug/metabolite transporter (DMT)-like permease
MLAVPHDATYFVFGAAPVVVLALGVLVAMRPKLSSSTIAALLLVFGVAVLAAGIVGGIHGEREKDEKKSESKGEQGLAPMPAPAATVIRVGA